MKQMPKVVFTLTKFFGKMSVAIIVAVLHCTRLKKKT